MALIIGTDEAGYGPKLGPLVISATCWEVGENHSREVDLYDLLGPRITSQATSCQSDQIAVGDSKTLYQSGGSLSRIERAVLGFLTQIGLPVATQLDQFANWLAPSRFVQVPEVYSTQTCQIPNQCAVEEIAELSSDLEQLLKGAGIQLTQVVSRVIFPQQFNAEISENRNKSELLSDETMSLVRHLIAGRRQDALITCDKHGGRNRYAGLVQQHLTREWVVTESEQREESRYHWSDRGDGESYEREIRFTARGERYLQIALASMVSKYVRELFMKSWNDFWKQYLPTIRPTAGYPVDARRFKREIEEIQHQLGIPDQEIWRCR